MANKKGKAASNTVQQEPLDLEEESPAVHEMAPSMAKLDLGTISDAARSGYDVVEPAAHQLQQPLFPGSELLMPNVLRTYRKGISLLHSMPVNRDQNHSLNSRRLTDAIAALVQVEYKKLPKAMVDQMRELNASPMFYVSRGELRKMSGIRSKDYSQIDKLLEYLRNTPFRWNVLGEDDQVEWAMVSSFLSTYGVGKGPKEGMLCLAIDPRVLELILEPKLWVSLQFEVMPQLRLEAAYALYQQCWRYIGTANKVTADLPTETWIELMIGHSRYVKTDEKTGAKSVENYSDFKRRYLLPAMELINGLKALQHSLILNEHRSGLKVKRIQFKFEQKRQESLDLPISWSNVVLDSLRGMGFSEEEIAALGQGFTSDEVIDSLGRLSKAQERKAKDGEKISSLKSFFNGILTNVSNAPKGTVKPELDDDELQKIERAANAEDAERKRKEREERAQQDFAQRRNKIFRDSLLAWPESRRADLFKHFEGSVECLPPIRRMIAEGWDNAGAIAWNELRAWLQKNRSEDFNELLPNPEDRTMEAWLLWRLDEANQSAG